MFFVTWTTTNALGILLVLIWFAPQELYGQIQGRSLSLGAEYNIYRDRQIAGIRLETLKNSHHSLNFRIAGNKAKCNDSSRLKLLWHKLQLKKGLENDQNRELR